MTDNPDIMAHDAVEADHEGAGQGYTPSLEPDDPFLSAINLGYMQASQGCFPAIPVKKQVNFGLGQESASQLGAAPDSLIAYNSQRATLHYATNRDHAQGITLVLGGPKNPQELLPLTLLDSGANTSIVTRQYCQVHSIPYEPCTLRLNTASGAASSVLGKVAVPAQVVFAINTPEEAYTPLTLFVVEGSTPAVFELLPTTEVLRVIGAYVDPLSDILVYRPEWQSEGDPVSCALLPVRITTPRKSLPLICLLMCQ